MKNKSNAGVRHNPKAVGRPRKVGVERGRGPRHADNAKEGEEMPSTDTVPAMLTPREAVLNRNAAELAGRDKIEVLNAKGNALAEQGVDLAGGNMKSKQKLQRGGYAGRSGIGQVRNPYAEGGGGNQPYPMMPQGEVLGWGGNQGGAQPLVDMPQGEQLPSGYPVQGVRGQTPGWGGQGQGQRHRRGGFGGGFYPHGQGPFGAQEGASEVPDFLENPQKAYGPPVQLSAPEILQYLQKAGKEQGLSAGQIAGLAKAFQGAGSAVGGGGAGSYYGSEGAAMGSAMGQLGGYQGGISDIGYPPFVMGPGAEYHADKGSTWVGAFDPAYMIPRY